MCLNSGGWKWNEWKVKLSNAQMPKNWEDHSDIADACWRSLYHSMSNSANELVISLYWLFCNLSEQISIWSQRAAVRDLLLIFCTLANVCTQWHGISWTSKCIIFISSQLLILEETVMSSALPFVKSGKLQVLSIYICSLKGSIKARFVFSALFSLCIQQIGAFCSYSSVYNGIL